MEWVSKMDMPQVRLLEIRPSTLSFNLSKLPVDE
jgi:hypothetical protein